MKYQYQNFEHLENVIIKDVFWDKVLEKIQDVMIPYVFGKFESLDGFYNNFLNLLNGKTNHHGNPFDDGLMYESLRGASDFLAIKYDEKLDKLIDKYIDTIEKVQNLDKDGYIHTYVTMTCPEYRWAQNGGNLMWQHDIWTAGCLIEAGVHHYRATGKTKLLKCGIKFANYMVSFMGEPPKKNIVPAHSLPEEAMVKLY